MTRWPGWLIALASVGYLVGLTAGSAAWMYRRALADVRGRGVEPDQLFVVVHFRPWWVALLVVPPLALIAWWVRTRR